MTADTRWPVPRSTTGQVVFACWIAILAEGYDVGVLGAVLPALAQYEPWSLSPLELGALGSYALVGMMIGAMLIGTLSDLYGRKRMLVVAMIIFTTTQLGAALAPTPEIFGLFRLLGGLGMGGIIPVAAALTIEYTAPRRRLLNYGIMYSGYSLGIVMAALVALLLIGDLGWRWVVGLGAAPIVLLPFISYMLPESLEYLVGKGKDDRARRVAARFRIAPFVPAEWIPAPSAEAAPAERLGWRKVFVSMFSGGYALATIGFWIALFCGLLLVYGLNTWIPSIMREAGYDLGSSLTFLLVFSLASAIGGLVLGWAADAFGKKRILVIFYALGAAGILLLMFPAPAFVTYIFVAIAGVGTISTSLVLTGWVAAYYPPFARATATGWALSFARVGAIAGPLIGGAIASLALGFEWNFLVFAAVGALAAVMILVIPNRPRGARSEARESEPAAAAGSSPR